MTRRHDARDRLRRGAPAAALLAVLGWLALGCGLGTEIGNGNRPKDDGEGDDRQASNRTDDGAEPMNGTPEAGTATGTGAAGGAPGGTDTDAATDGVMGGNGAMASAAARFGFDPVLLSPPCASPFAAGLGGPSHDLRRASDGATLLARRTAADDGWDVGSYEGEVAFRAKPGPAAGTVELFDVAGAPLAVTTACGTPETGAVTLVNGVAGDYRRTRVAVVAGGKEYTLMWFVTADGDRLVRLVLERYDELGKLVTDAFDAP